VTGRLVVMTGTGTGIGKTHLSEALLLGLRRLGRRAVGLKPIESGVAPGVITDAARLSSASAFHVKPFGLALVRPVSPHLAARLEGVTLDVEALVAGVAAARLAADIVLVELPGGLFTPLAPGLVGVNFAARLGPEVLLLAAPDRLGVLHDLIATCRAAGSGPARIDGIVLIAPEVPDESTGTNAGELADYVSVPVLASVPRGSPADLADSPALGQLLSRLK
jgi:dethiobiotin synthetase